MAIARTNLMHLNARSEDRNEAKGDAVHQDDHDQGGLVQELNHGKVLNASDKQTRKLRERDREADTERQRDSHKGTGTHDAHTHTTHSTRPIDPISDQGGG